MANHKTLAPFVRSWEGGYSNRKADRGGATNKGVTLATWKVYCGKVGKVASVDTLKRITDAEWDDIFKDMYWDKCHGDDIKDQNIANILVDWYWNSGKWAVKHVQRIVGVKDDGICGMKTIAAINGQGDLTLFGKIKQDRIKFLKALARNSPSQKANLNGWLRRVDCINYGSLTLNK